MKELARGPRWLRVQAGLGICWFPIFAFYFGTTSHEAAPGLFLAWIAIVVIYGCMSCVRVLRAGVFIDRSMLVVRNMRWRKTRTVPLSSVTSVTFEQRRAGVLQHGNTTERWIGVVHLVDGSEIEMDPTESRKVFLYGTLLSKSKDVAAREVDAIRRAISSRTGMTA